MQGDCLDRMSEIADNSINMILCDLPYGVTQNHWDYIIPVEPMWVHYRRMLCPNGLVVLTATQPFASMLVMSNVDMFKYDLIWNKTIASGQLNVNKQPLRTHEHVLIFYKKPPVYNEQKTPGEPYSIKREAKYSNQNYGTQKANAKVNDGYRHAKSVITVSNPRIKGGHPTQKPNELLEMLIKTYTNPDQTILDNCMGSGSTGVAAINLSRKFIGIENDPTYFTMAISNLEEAIASTYLGQDICDYIDIDQ